MCWLTGLCLKNCAERCLWIGCYTNPCSHETIWLLHRIRKSVHQDIWVQAGTTKTFGYLAKTYIIEDINKDHMCDMIKQARKFQLNCVTFREVEDDKYNDFTPMVDKVWHFIDSIVYGLLWQLGFDHETAIHDLSITYPMNWPWHLQRTVENIKCYWM